MLITAVSVFSASAMAPDRGDPAALQISLLTGSVDDFCGDGIDPDHHCPFCRLLSDTVAPEPAGFAALFRPFDAWRQSAGLLRAAQARNRNHAPRAPPFIA
ncbi:MAG: hypothetical protein P1U48_09865 [Pseudooceanicola sp.]|nr:hypothetical protein [Pseudooceanicola sp.]